MSEKPAVPAAEAIAEFERAHPPICPHCRCRFVVTQIVPNSNPLEWSYRCPGCGHERTIKADTEIWAITEGPPTKTT
jgi:transposase-like protein